MRLFTESNGGRGLKKISGYLKSTHIQNIEDQQRERQVGNWWTNEGAGYPFGCPPNS